MGNLADVILSPCPCCGSKVDWTTARYLNIGTIHISCSNEDCGLCVVEEPFRQEYIHLGDFEDKYRHIENICERWNLWCDTNPTRYGDVCWEEGPLYSPCPVFDSL